MAESFKLGERLRSMWMPQRALFVIENGMMTAQLVCIESMRDAARSLWSDFLPTFDQEIEG